MYLLPYISFNPAPFFRKHSRLIAILMALPLILFMSGCSYFKIRQKPANTETLSIYNKPEQYFILHVKGEAKHISKIVLDSDMKKLSGTLSELGPKHQTYLNVENSEETKPRLFRAKNQRPTDEVHIYAKSIIENPDGTVTITEDQLEKIEVYDWAVGATTFSYVFSSIGVLAGALVIVAVIILATKSSCPFVYIQDGGSYTFHGEIFSGAIYPSIERMDYLPIVLQNETDTLNLKIANELLEIQHINLAQIVSVHHPQNIEVLMDKAGNMHTIGTDRSEALHYQSALTFTALQKKDNQYHFFTEEDKGVSEQKLSFVKPNSSQKAKLVLTGQNTMWLDFMYGKFNESFGAYYNKFAKEQGEKPAAENIKWYKEQNIPLTVYVETRDGWKLVDYFDVVGPLASRNMVMEIDLADVEGAMVNVKLVTGFQFWQLDYAALDFSQNLSLPTEIVTASTAIDQNGNEVHQLLAEKDNAYLIQKNIGDYTNLQFALPKQAKGMKQTYFLQSSGYYQYIRDYKGFPNVAKLNEFKKKGSFNRFAKEEYQKLYKNTELISKAFNNGN